MLLALAGLALWGQTGDPARPLLEKAYAALRARQYQEAVACFRQAAEAAPARADIRKNLAYTYLKIGEPEAARDQFAEALRLDPADTHVTLEYAFLCHETMRRAEARRIFDRLRRSADGAARATAEEAFRNIDRPLAEGIARWSEAVGLAPDNFSAHWELATLAEQRDDLDLAAKHYEAALRLRPAEHQLLLDLGRVWKASGQSERAWRALLEAARSAEPRVAEAARELLPPELLTQAGGPSPQGHPDQARLSAKELAERSYRAGYLKDALWYLKLAHEADPADFAVMLQLGRTYNLLRQDQQAVRWFAMARKSPETALAREADRAYRNLRPGLARFRTTAWVLPFYSSRWKDLFSYGQVKTEIRLGRLPLRPYLSTRFIGDTRRITSEAMPQYLSESSFLLALGLAASPWRGLTLWGEAGTAASYLRRPGAGRAVPDYRGGAAYQRGYGHLLGAEAPGPFLEIGLDGVFVSRFQNDFLFYWQNRAGYTLPAWAGLRVQLCWNGNLTADSRRQYWTNFAESGPGVRLRWPGLPESLVFTGSVLRGVYTRNQDNPRRPNFNDLRVGFAYAITR